MGKAPSRLCLAHRQNEQSRHAAMCDAGSPIEDYPNGVALLYRQGVGAAHTVWCNAHGLGREGGLSERRSLQAMRESRRASQPRRRNEFRQIPCPSGQSRHTSSPWITRDARQRTQVDLLSEPRSGHVSVSPNPEASASGSSRCTPRVRNGRDGQTEVFHDGPMCSHHQ
jgi:hypothetical protein